MKRTMFVASVLIGTITVGACGGSDTAPRGMGTLVVQLTDAPFPTGNYAMAVLPTVTGAARWTAPDGAERAGQVPVRAGTPAGTAVTVWTDTAGEPPTRAAIR